GKTGEIDRRVRLGIRAFSHAHRLDPAQLVDVFAKRQAVGLEPERNDVGRCGAHYNQRVKAGGGGGREGFGIAELIRPVEVVVDRMVDAVRSFEAGVDDGHSEVVDESRIVRARAQPAHLRAESPWLGLTDVATAGGIAFPEWVSKNEGRRGGPGATA